MNDYLQQSWEKLRAVPSTARRFLLSFKRLLLEQLNKNIYTRILFTNVTIFVVVMIALVMLSTFIVKQATYDQTQQELSRKGRRVNFALLQETNHNWQNQPSDISSERAQERQDLLKFLADTFDTRITVFDGEGIIMGSSAEQEVVSGSKVDEKFIQILAGGEPTIIRKTDRDTGQLIFTAFVPMGSNIDPTENGILLESNPINLDLTLNSIRQYLLLGGIAILVVVIFISVYLAMYISTPISRLSANVAEISRGNYILCENDQPLDEISDLTNQLNKMTVRLQKIQAASSRMEEDRSKLFAEISHELRTPLTTVQGFVEAIRDGMVQNETILERYLDTIYTQTVHITRLVDDMLSLSRLESGNITVEKLPVDMAALAQGVVKSMEGLAAGKNTSLLLEKKTEEAIVLGDVDRMEQVLRNVLKNAVRATENGTIRVGVESRKGQILLTIADNGTGISSEDLPHIWDRFYRAKNQRSRYMHEHGSGLGLVIVKKLVQLQDGKIDVDSQLGEGTTFRISFPSYVQK